ncbi:MAG: type II secretion system F family protein [Armatimonadetes bacterium]|nr:type II secretion system F family protein [Armatimonadota bacterium]
MKRRAGLRFRSRKTDGWHLIQFFRQMAVLSRAGMALIRSLEICRRQCSNEPLQQAIDRVVEELRAGTRLSAAFRATGQPFTPLYASAVQAAETAGKLPEVFEELAHWEQKEHRLRKRLSSALSYPIFILVVSTVGVLLLIKFLLPVVLSVSEQLTHPPGLPTRILIAVGEVVDRPLRLGLCLAALALAVWWVRRLFGRRADYRVRWDRVRLSLPLTGGILRTTVTIRVCRSMASLLQSGLSMVDALQLTGQSAGSPYVQATILDPAAQYIRRGESLSQALGGARIFPPSFHGMVAVGEKSGKLETILIHLADLSELELDQRIETFIRALEPLAVVFVGAVVLGVMICAFMPLYEMMQNM